MDSAQLRVTTRGKTRRFDVTGEKPVSLGRGSACTIVIDDAALSRQHCQLTLENGALIATDLDSSNGTWLDQQRIKRIELRPGMVLRIGSTEVALEPFAMAGGKGAAQANETAIAAPMPLPPPDGKELIGTDLGDYRILGILGSGGAAIVYRAEQLKLGREVALKVLRQTAGNISTKQIDAFLREARSAAKLNDPRLVQVYDAGSDKGYYFLSMELVHGGSLARVLRANGPLAWQKALPILRDIAAALQCTHDAGLVHRDVKPANILITLAGGAKLADLGLAGGETHAGTMAFIAPEQLISANVDHRADLYSLGCTAHVMLTGSPPFLGSRREMADAHRTTTPKSLREVGVIVPKELEHLILVCLMAKTPEDRPKTAALVVEELDRIANSTTSSTADTDELPLLENEVEIAADRLRIGSQLPKMRAPPMPLPTPAPFPAALPQSAPHARSRPAPILIQKSAATDPVYQMLVIAIILSLLAFIIFYFI
ncbi:MAG: serine/threonine-protein kinase [Planctomycetota bacterium]|nr:serine/threonine-protein kinase [Planctomycetota bacterium]